MFIHNTDSLGPDEVLGLAPDDQLYSFNEFVPAFKFSVINGCRTPWGNVSTLEEALQRMPGWAAKQIQDVHDDARYAAEEIAKTATRVRGEIADRKAERKKTEVIPPLPSRDLQDQIVALLDGKNDPPVPSVVPVAMADGQDLGDAILAVLEAAKAGAEVRP